MRPETYADRSPTSRTSPLNLLSSYTKLKKVLNATLGQQIRCLIDMRVLGAATVRPALALGSGSRRRCRFPEISRSARRWCEADYKDHPPDHDAAAHSFSHLAGRSARFPLRCLTGLRIRIQMARAQACVFLHDVWTLPAGNVVESCL